MRSTPEHVEERLDDMLADTFPASDPLQLEGLMEEKRSYAATEETLLDDMLADTFPASDPLPLGGVG